MSILFSKVLKQALITFDRTNSAKLKTNINILKDLVDQLTISDIGLNYELISEEDFTKPYKAPCTFINIFENNQIAMSVFVLRGDFRMPLHDHPIMHGILKVLVGKVVVQSYTKINKNDEINLYERNTHKINVLKENAQIIDSTSKSMILTPAEKNFHEITAIKNVAAFFDILSPPYDANIPIYGKRSCNFYKSFENTNDSNITCVLEKIPAPETYYCDTGYYNKPNFFKQYVENSQDSDK